MSQLTPSSLTGLVPPRHQRFLSDHRDRYLAYIKAAKTYAGQIEPMVGNWLYQKPYERLPDHREYFSLNYALMNLLQVMAVPLKGRILEVGSGPGWLTEILAGLSYEVYSLEPSEEMIAVARERVAGFKRHYRLDTPVHFLCEPLEECSLPDGSVDGVIFHESFHHVVDEDRALAQCFRALVPGGVLGVTGEGAWVPGDRNIEQACEEEMARYGTLENPFTYDYVRYLLARHGFEEVTRYHGVNGFFPEGMGHRPLRELAQMRADHRNHFTARKPEGFPTTANRQGSTSGTIRLVEVSKQPDGALRVVADVTNTGQTHWLPVTAPRGGVRLSLSRNRPRRDLFHRVVRRVTRLVGMTKGPSQPFTQAPALRGAGLRVTLPPNGTTRLEAVYLAPEGGWSGEWEASLAACELEFGGPVRVRLPE